MEKLTITSDNEKLARFAKAISHPTRVAVMFFLANKPEGCYFGDIHNVLHIAKPTLSQHLKELKGAGLIVDREFPPKVLYRINSEVWDEIRLLFATFFDMCSCHKGDCHCGCNN